MTSDPTSNLIYLSIWTIYNLLTFERLWILVEVFRRLCVYARHIKLCINQEKCHFSRQSLKYLGHFVDSRGIRTDSAKTSTNWLDHDQLFDTDDC